MSDRSAALLVAAIAAALLAPPAVAGSHPSSRRTEDSFRATMDRTFGPGGWRQTSGYRTRAQEDALRRQGAGTVAPGRTSSHSLGGRRAPGAYDAVVPGMSQAEAAARLRRSGKGFPRVVAERRHGPQGPHLHIELQPGLGGSTHTVCDRYRGEVVHVRIVNGRRNPLVECEERWRSAQRRKSSEPVSGLLD